MLLLLSQLSGYFAAFSSDEKCPPLLLALTECTVYLLQYPFKNPSKKTCHDLDKRLAKIAYKIWSRLSHVSGKNHP